MNSESVLRFYPLTIVVDAPDHVVGRTDIESYAVFPEDGVALLKELQTGMSIQAAAAWYEECYGTSIDMADFIETLRDLQFLLEEGEEVTMPPVLSPYWQWIGRAAFSPFAWILYSALIGYCTYLMFQFPYLRPARNHIFFSPLYTVVELGLFFGQVPGLFFHESFHMLAGLRLGLPSRLGLGRRLYFLVFETHLNGLWSVPRRKRYLPFLAGMLGDVLWFSLLTICASLTYNPASPFVGPGSFLLAMAFITILRLVWQFYFFLQTDLYYVFTNALRCIDLQQVTQQFLLNRLYRLIGWQHKSFDEEQWNPRDRQVALWYAPIFVMGYLVSIAAFLFIALPIAFAFLKGVVAHLSTWSPLTPGFWDAGIFLLLNMLQFALIALIRVNERTKARIEAQKREMNRFHDEDEVEQDLGNPSATRI